MKKAIGVLSVFALLVLPGIASALTVDELLDLVVERMTQLQSVHQQASMQVTFEMAGDVETVEQDSVFIFQRPSQLVIDSDMLTLVSDGEQFLIVFPQFEHFIEQPLGDTLSETLSDLEDFVGSAALPDIAAVLSDDPRAVLAEFLSEVKVEVLGEDRRDGRPVWALRIRIEDEEVALPEGLNVWIDQETGLVVGMEAKVDLTDFQDAAFPADLPTGYALQYRVTYLAINESLPDDLFSYDTAGYTRVEDFDALSESLQLMMTQGGGLLLQDQPAPDFELTLLDGSVFRLSDHKGKVVLVDFWATWCPPCVESLPYLQSMYEDIGGDNVIFVGVSLDRPGAEARVENMVELNGITYLVGMNADGEIANAYGAVSIPTLVVVDGEGIVRHTKVGFHPDAMVDVREAILRAAAEL